MGDVFIPPRNAGAGVDFCIRLFFLDSEKTASLSAVKLGIPTCLANKCRHCVQLLAPGRPGQVTSSGQVIPHENFSLLCFLIFFHGQNG